MIYRLPSLCSKLHGMETCLFPRIAYSISVAQLKNDAVRIFNCGVEAVQPHKTIARILNFQENTLHVENKSYFLNKNVYVIGFGKAVAGMAKKLECILNDHLISGIISVPEGTISELNKTKPIAGKIKILEGAKNNLPDENALKASKEIINFCSQCPIDSLLIVLISGGGSALLPLPIPPITLDEKQTLISKLSKCGADICELNAVRKSLSLVKGGGIVQFANSSKILSLILSDIIGDKVDFIASGPTVRNTDQLDIPMQILNKYQLLESIPDTIKQVLQQNASRNKEDTKSDFSRVQNVLIGSNKTALESAMLDSKNLGYASIVLTTELQGESRTCGTALALFAKIMYCAMSSKASKSNDNCTDAELEYVCRTLKISPEKIDQATNNAKMASQMGSGFCVLCGGETTVTVMGNGKGGRNQELALSFGIKLQEVFGTQSPELILLSAGTDGFDGPNNAAGAFGFPLLKAEAEIAGMNSEEYLRSNDSYNFYKHLANGEYHFITGHTGTNVMDIQILLMKS